MKRLLIFTILYPLLALLVFSAPDMIARHDLRLIDLTSLQWTYIIAVVPALLLAAFDWVLPKFRLVGTTIAGAAGAYLATFCVGFPFIDYRAVLMVGLVGAVPAAVCSWLSNINQGKQDI